VDDRQPVGNPAARQLHPFPLDYNNQQRRTFRAEDTVCPGWLMQITAKRSFAFQHGGEKAPVYDGVDNSTHLNIVTNYALVPAITGDGGGGEH
jgi:hypothetical protein